MFFGTVCEIFFAPMLSFGWDCTVLYVSALCLFLAPLL